MEPGPETLRLAGEICRVHEVADGGVEIFHAGQLLPSRALFDKNPHVSQGAIVASKRLRAVLARIQADQQERDRERLGRGSKLTLRQKERIRAARDRADAMTTSPCAG